MTLSVQIVSWWFVSVTVNSDCHLTRESLWMQSVSWYFMSVAVSSECQLTIYGCHCQCSLSVDSLSHCKFRPSVDTLHVSMQSINWHSVSVAVNADCQLTLCWCHYQCRLSVDALSVTVNAGWQSMQSLWVYLKHEISTYPEVWFCVIDISPAQVRGCLSMLLKHLLHVVSSWAWFNYVEYY